MQYNAIVKNIKEITPEIKLFFVKFKDEHKNNDCEDEANKFAKDCLAAANLEGR